MLAEGSSRWKTVVPDLPAADANKVKTELTQQEVVVEDYGGTYGVPTPECLDAIRLAARTEGLILDPVYTGKAMAGLADLVRRGRWREDQTVVFWHTGGQPALFAHARELEGPA